MGKKENVIGTGWKYQPVPKGLPPYVSVAASLVPAGISNRYQWKPKAAVEKPGVLSRGQWSRLRGTGCETGAFGPSQPVPKAHFLVVYLANSTGPDIAFAVNLLARHSAAPTKSHWIRGKQVLRYLNVKKDLRLFFGKTQDHGHSSFSSLRNNPFMQIV